MEKMFTFAEVFTAYFENGVCHIEQYGEGRYVLPTVTTEEGFMLLEMALTGDMFKDIISNHNKTLQTLIYNQTIEELNNARTKSKNQD
jgi:hypothetical protein